MIHITRVEARLPFGKYPSAKLTQIEANELIVDNFLSYMHAVLRDAENQGVVLDKQTLDACQAFHNRLIGAPEPRTPVAPFGGTEPASDAEMDPAEPRQLAANTPISDNSDDVYENMIMAIEYMYQDAEPKQEIPLPELHTMLKEAGWLDWLIACNCMSWVEVRRKLIAQHVLVKQESGYYTFNILG